MRLACLSIVLAFTSCGGEPAPTRPEPPAAESDHGAPTDEATDSVAPPTSIVPDGTPPNVALVATPGPSTVAFSLANHGPTDVSLRASVIVEVGREGSFGAAPSASTLALRYDCAHEADDCVTLAPGAELVPPEWLGTWGDMQCICTRCGPVEAGDYRLVVTTCDGGHRIESNTFGMPSR